MPIGDAAAPRCASPCAIPARRPSGPWTGTRRHRRHQCLGPIKIFRGRRVRGVYGLDLYWVDCGFAVEAERDDLAGLFGQSCRVANVQMRHVPNLQADSTRSVDQSGPSENQPVPIETCSERRRQVGTTKHQSAESASSTRYEKRLFDSEGRLDERGNVAKQRAGQGIHALNVYCVLDFGQQQPGDPRTRVDQSDHVTQAFGGLQAVDAQRYTPVTRGSRVRVEPAQYLVASRLLAAGVYGILEVYADQVSIGRHRLVKSIDPFT